MFFAMMCRILEYYGIRVFNPKKMVFCPVLTICLRCITKRHKVYNMRYLFVALNWVIMNTTLNCTRIWNIELFACDYCFWCCSFVLPFPYIDGYIRILHFDLLECTITNRRWHWNTV